MLIFGWGAVPLEEIEAIKIFLNQKCICLRRCTGNAINVLSFLYHIQV